MLGAIATGETEVRGFLPGCDCQATLAAMQSLGVRVSQKAPDHLVISGTGPQGLHAAEASLDLGNSGTGMRLLAGLLAGMPFDSVLTGDESLSQRPMRRIAEPLRRMGAVIGTTDGHAPLYIEGQRLSGIDYTVPVASAQVKSAVLLAAMYAKGLTRLRETAATRDHTERLLRWLGCEFRETPGEISLPGGQALTGRRIDVAGDFSAAAFFIVAAAIAADDVLVIENVGVNPTRVGLLELLSMMGADINIGAIRNQSGEPVADIEVRRTRLRGIDVPAELVPSSIDEFPVFFVAAASATGTTRLSGARELRVKESDRIAVMAEGLSRLGIDARPTPDGMSIEGGQLRSGSVMSHGDHRIAMAFAVASLVAEAEITVCDVANVATSFPGFVDAALSVGFNIEHE